MLTIVQARNDLLSKLGITDAATATPLILQDVMIAINGAMQMLQTAGQDFFTRETINVGLTAGQSVYDVNQSIQAVLGPIRWNDLKPLRALTSEGEYDQFARIFLGQPAYGPGTFAAPVAYFVKYLRTVPGDEGDICSVQIKVAPAPTSPPGSLTVEVVNDARSYTVDQLDDETVLPVAQNYTESVFLPIARMLVLRSSQFSRPDILDQINTDGERAMAILGASGGFPNAVQPALKREVEA